MWEDFLNNLPNDNFLFSLIKCAKKTWDLIELNNCFFEYDLIKKKVKDSK